MNIQIPRDLEDSVRAAVRSGLFETEDEMVAVALREYLRRSQEEQPAVDTSTLADAVNASMPKPIWEVIEEENGVIPPEVWDALPTDLSAQHDYYIYDSTKRPLE